MVEHTRQSGLNTEGKSDPCDPSAQPPKCPECTSQKVWKDGLRYTNTGTVQRYLCRSCGRRFSQPKVKVNVFGKGPEILHSPSNLTHQRISSADFPLKETPQDFAFFRGENVGSHELTTAEKDLNRFPLYSSNCRVCISEDEMKNLVEVESRIEKRAAGATEKLTKAEVKSELVNHAWWMKKQGYAEETIRVNGSCLRTLWKRGANLYDPESVKDVIARQSWSDNRRRNVINAYSLFLKLHGMRWEKPKCKVTRKLPFIPTEQELDALIAGCGKKTSTFLQLLKETAMRSGEAKRLEWTDIDFEKRLITLNYPEKGGNPRIWKVSTKLIGMLNGLPRNSRKIFGDGPINSLKTTFIKSRKRLATKLQNPRLLKISFHTLRHWKATMEYHKTKDPYHVKRFLGHKSLRSTEIYINIEQTIFEPESDEFTVKVVDKPEETKALLEVGFEYICQKDGLMFLRKRK